MGCQRVNKYCLWNFGNTPDRRLSTIGIAQLWYFQTLVFPTTGIAHNWYWVPLILSNIFIAQLWYLQPLVLNTIGIIHYWYWVQLVLYTFDNIIHWYWAPLVLSTTGIEHHWYWAPLVLSTSGFEQDWYRIIVNSRSPQFHENRTQYRFPELFTPLHQVYYIFPYVTSPRTRRYCPIDYQDTLNSLTNRRKFSMTKSIDPRYTNLGLPAVFVSSA